MNQLMMNEFLIGLFVGAIGSRLFSKKKKCTDSSTQMDNPVQTQPVSIPKRSSFIPGSLANFWGKDS
jgi:hypothetical protein